MADEQIPAAAPQLDTAGTINEGGAADESFSLGDVFKGEGQEQQPAPAPEKVEGQQQQQPATPTTPTADEISAKVLAGLQPKGQQTPTYTREQLDKMFEVYQPQMELVQAIREGDEAAALKAMGDLRDGLIKQMNTMTNFQMKILREELMQELSPALGAATRTEAARQEADFYSKNPDLSERKKAVATVFAAMKAEGKPFKSATEAAKALADRTRELLGLTAPASNGSGNGQPSASPQQQQPRPAALSNGSGASGGGGGSASTNVIADVFQP